MSLSSHAYAAPKPKNYLGIGFVAAVHLAAIYAFSAGLIHPKTTPPEPITLKPLAPEITEPPPPVKPLQAETPTLPTPQITQITTPDVIVEVIPDHPPVAAVTTRPDTGPLVANTGPTQAPTVAPQQGVKPAVQTPGAVCSVMPKPEVPVVNWAGEAVLQVMATVRSGRVVGTDIRVIQGALDSKSRRSLQRSVESALAGYQCQGDAMFQQDFAFRLE